MVGVQPAFQDDPVYQAVIVVVDESVAEFGDHRPRLMALLDVGPPDLDGGQAHAGDRDAIGRVNGEDDGHRGDEVFPHGTAQIADDGRDRDGCCVVHGGEQQRPAGRQAEPALALREVDVEDDGRGDQCDQRGEVERARQRDGAPIHHVRPRRSRTNAGGRGPCACA